MKSNETAIIEYKILKRYSSLEFNSQILICRLPMCIYFHNYSLDLCVYWYMSIIMWRHISHPSEMSLRDGSRHNNWFQSCPSTNSYYPSVVIAIFIHNLITIVCCVSWVFIKVSLRKQALAELSKINDSDPLPPYHIVSFSHNCTEWYIIFILFSLKETVNTINLHFKYTRCKDDQFFSPDSEKERHNLFES